jgi:hypothetical protein
MVIGTHLSIGQYANHGQSREAIQLMVGGEQEHKIPVPTVYML